MKKIYNSSSVVFLGTDGSGKSTIIEQMTPLIQNHLKINIHYEHLRPNWIPSIASLLGSDNDFKEDTTKPHNKKPSGYLGSILRLCYYLIDYTIGYIVKVKIKTSGEANLWVFDRYYYDYLIDPLRTRVSLPKGILSAGLKIIPKPDLIICLGANAEVIHRRKPELTLDEVKRQVDELKLFCDKTKNAIWIDTGVSIDQSVQETIDAIYNSIYQLHEK